MVKWFKNYTEDEVKLQHEKLLRLYDYSSEKGMLVRKVATGPRGKVGSVVGGNATRYRYVIFDDKDIPLHHLVWFFHKGYWASEYLKFRDVNPANVRIENLYESTAQESALTSKVRSTNKSGVKGISWSETEQKWQVHIYRNYGTVGLGSFVELDAAKEALNSALEKSSSEYTPTIEQKDAAFIKYKKKSLWDRVNKEFSEHGWFSSDALYSEMGEPPTRSYKLVAINDAFIIGPGNAVWKVPEFDLTTRKGRIEASEEYYADNYTKYRAAWLQDKFGISIEEYHAKVEEQNGCCAICNKPETTFRMGKLLPLSVDHCHRTNKVRGLLCNTCNQGIGKLQDSAEMLRIAASYVDKWNEIHEPSLPKKSIEGNVVTFKEYKFA